MEYPVNNLLNEILNVGINERIKELQQCFIDNFKRKVMSLIEASRDDKAIIKSIVEYLDKLEFDIFSRNRY